MSSMLRDTQKGVDMSTYEEEEEKSKKVRKKKKKGRNEGRRTTRRIGVDPYEYSLPLVMVSYQFTIQNLFGGLLCKTSKNR